MKPSVPAAADSRRRRRRLALWSAVPAIGALAVAAKLLSVGFLGASVAGAFEAGNATDAGTAAAWLNMANILEPHKAPFAAGDARVLAGDFAGARSDFEAALAAQPGTDECAVRVNLALSIEKLGDAAVAADTAKATGLYGEALGVIEAAPQACHTEGPGNSNGEGDELASAGERLRQKQTAGGGRNATQTPPPEQPSAPESRQLQQLQESARRAQGDRLEGQQRDQYLHGPDTGGGVDRPW